MITLRRIMDLPSLMAWRDEVLGCVFGTTPDAELMKANRDYYTRHCPDGSHIAIVASSDGEDAGCGSLCIHDELPSPDNPSGRCGYLMNVYVREPFRHAGVGGVIIDRLVTMARDNNCGKIYLESTDGARHIYRTHGFTEMKNMLEYDNTQN
ncbi:MAG: GNAT family N-acetyltransferase [Muribaculaceae bacterium]|nr:GNAT family N-acetyltransferase [Muribaculaceae bacterium]